MESNRKRVSCFVGLAATLVTAGAALAGPQDYWATGGDGTDLVRIDKTTGAGTTVGSSGQSSCWAAGFTPDGTLWGMSNGFSGNAQLGYFNLLTGFFTTVGSGMGTSMICLDSDSSGNMYGVGYNDQQLYSINTGTGTASAIGSTGLSSMMDLAFDASGTLWAVNSGGVLYTINTTTGASTSIVTLSGVSGGEMGIAFDSTGTLYLTDYTSNSTLYTVNTGTGFATTIGSTGIYASHGGDFEPQNIPLPPAMLLGMIGLGGVVIVRRRFTA